jgi:ribosomal protein S19
MSRSNWKIPFVALCFNKNSFLKNKNLKIWSRKSTIPEFLVGKQISIHNGQKFKKILITRDIVGYKFGDFCSTKKYSVKQKTIKKINGSKIK